MRPTPQDKATLTALATSLRAIAVEVLPMYVERYPWPAYPDPLAGMCGFAAIGVVEAAAELAWVADCPRRRARDADVD